MKKSDKILQNNMTRNKGPNPLSNPVVARKHHFFRGEILVKLVKGMHDNFSKKSYSVVCVYSLGICSSSAEDWLPRLMCLILLVMQVNTNEWHQHLEVI